ncbi:MAG TPA: signal peptidase II [Syntrophomonadaceae bacterium]|nr:signal peptidase II [Syntrophomonadaceae bacterium]
MKKEILNVVFFMFITFVLLAVDQVTKALIVNNMRPGESIAVIERFFHITYVRNPGGAFGILAYRTELFIILAILFILIVVALPVYFPGRNLKLTCALAVLTGGVMGNLIDRLRSGYVIDFLDFRFWPVFNAADVFIFTGTVFLFIFLLRKAG